MKRILLIAYHYPPVSVSSGLQRTLSFSRYLPENGWEPAVLTAHPRAYRRVSDDQIQDIPEDISVVRAFALDTSRHLAFRRRYLGILALPDQWASWWLGAVVSGLRLIRRFRPDALWSTYPIATAHLVGLTLHRLSGIPWVADFRDLMVESNYPENPRQRKISGWIEAQVVVHCRRAVFTTSGAMRVYAHRYPSIPEDRWKIIANGYDDGILASVQKTSRPAREPGEKITLLHSGIIYPKYRDPRCFFDALARLFADGTLSRESLRVNLRGTAYDETLGALIKEHGLEDVVSLLPAVAYREALREMYSADALLVLQGSGCNDQIPAKVYEYLAARKPIFALTDPVGDTASLLTSAGIDTIAPMDETATIARELLGFLSLLESGRAPLVSEQEAARHSRRARSKELAKLLDELLA